MPEAHAVTLSGECSDANLPTKSSLPERRVSGGVHALRATALFGANGAVSLAEGEVRRHLSAGKR